MPRTNKHESPADDLEVAGVDAECKIVLHSSSGLGGSYYE